MGFWNTTKIEALIPTEGCHLDTAIGSIWVIRWSSGYGWLYSVGLVAPLDAQQGSSLLNMLAAFPPKSKPEVTTASD